MLFLVQLLNVANGAVGNAQVVVVLDVDDRMLLLELRWQLLVAAAWRDWWRNVRHGSGRCDVQDDLVNFVKGEIARHIPGVLKPVASSGAHQGRKGPKGK